MADYFSQLVIRPRIPLSAMTGLERRILAGMFFEEVVGEEAYFFASHGPNDLIHIETSDAARLLEADKSVASRVADLVRKELTRGDPRETELDLDMSVIGFEPIFQDIVRRSELEFVEVETAWTCSKMRPDGFGGMATLITADAAQSMSTTGFLENAIARLGDDGRSD